MSFSIQPSWDVIFRIVPSKDSFYRNWWTGTKHNNFKWPAVQLSSRALTYRTVQVPLLLVHCNLWLTEMIRCPGLSSLVYFLRLDSPWTRLLLE